MYIPITKNFTIKACGRKKSPLLLYFTILPPGNRNWQHYVIGIRQNVTIISHSVTIIINQSVIMLTHIVTILKQSVDIISHNLTILNLSVTILPYIVTRLIHILTIIGHSVTTIKNYQMLNFSVTIMSHCV